MEDEAGVLQQRIELRAVGRRGKKAQERIGGEKRKAQKRRADHALHRQHPGLQCLAQPVGRTAPPRRPAAPGSAPTAASSLHGCPRWRRTDKSAAGRRCCAPPPGRWKNPWRQNRPPGCRMRGPRTAVAAGRRPGPAPSAPGRAGRRPTAGPATAPIASTNARTSASCPISAAIICDCPSYPLHNPSVPSMAVK